VLTEFQKAILTNVSRVAEAEGFALAGGAALILQGLVDRHTRDLDFFAREPNAVNRTCPAIETALRNDGMQVERRIDAVGFIRLEVSLGNEICEVDLGYDARLRPEERNPFGRVLATEELAADKTLALFGRAAARDFVDVFYLSRLLGEEHLCELAGQKDLGFDKRHLADALRAFSRLDRDLFEVDEATYRSIRTWSISWRERLLMRGIEHERASGPDRANESGLDISEF
jgi:predicted nucleotidyltransferase component of viral defense system